MIAVTYTLKNGNKVVDSYHHKLNDAKAKEATIAGKPHIVATHLYDEKHLDLNGAIVIRVKGAPL